MKITLDPGDIVKKGAANHLEHGIAIGGQLFLGNKVILFTPHILNPVRQTIIQLEDVQSVTEARTKLFGVVPTLDNAIDVTLHDGTVHQFTLWGRDIWISEIQRTMAAMTGTRRRSTTPGAPPLPSSSLGEFCPFCGKKVGEGTKFCIHCGAAQ